MKGNLNMEALAEEVADLAHAALIAADIDDLEQAEFTGHAYGAEATQALPDTLRAATAALEGGLSGLLDMVLRLRDLGIPHTLDRIGVDDARFDALAAMAVVDPTAAGNPRRLSEVDAREFYVRASQGRLG